MEVTTKINGSIDSIQGHFVLVNGERITEKIDWGDTTEGTFVLARQILQRHTSDVNLTETMKTRFAESFLIGIPSDQGFSVRIPVKRWIAIVMDADKGMNSDGKLGECCSCGTLPAVHVLAMPHATSIPGTGWGCDTCNLPRNGAVVVLCDGCQRVIAKGSSTLTPWMVHSYHPFQARILRASWADQSFVHDETYHDKFGDDLDAALAFWAANTEGR